MPSFRRSRAIVRAVLPAFVVTVALLVGAASPVAGASKPKAGFATFSLASTPPAPAGTVCPGGNGCSNGAAEPAIRAARDGAFYGSSENGLGAGTVAWKSTDGGRHFSSLLSPNNLSATRCTRSRGASCGRSSREARAGESVSELIAEMTVEMAIVSANWR